MSEQIVPFEERDLAEVVPSTQLSEKPKWQLKKLTYKHKEIAGLLVSGESHDQIAEICKVNKQTIVVLKTQPIFQEYFQKLQQEIEDDFSNLFGKSVVAVRDGLGEDKPAETRLKAAKLVFESQGRLDGVNVIPESAEDIARRLVLNQQIVINVNR